MVSQQQTLTLGTWIADGVSKTKVKKGFHCYRKFYKVLHFCYFVEVKRHWLIVKFLNLILFGPIYIK